MSAISKVSELIYSGNGWDNYNCSKTVQENIDRLYNGSCPDIVIAYKPLDLKNFSDIKCVKCTRYNEMWNIENTKKEIAMSKFDFVVCHHLNDMSYYINRFPNIKFVNISHCAEKTIYMDYGEKKIYDVILVGATECHHYPFRVRLRSIVHNCLSKSVKCKVLSHPGDPGLPFQKIHGATGKEYAKEINRAKITLTCSSKYKYRLGKYTEIPMCASLLAADLPNEDQDFFKQFMLVLDPKSSDVEIASKIVEYVKDDAKRNAMIQKGLELNKEYTQEKYAERFIKLAEDFLKEKK
jgi:hypothetical protein